MQIFASSRYPVRVRLRCPRAAYRELADLLLGDARCSLASGPVAMIEAVSMPIGRVREGGAATILDLRAERCAEAWYDWECARVAATVERGDAVFLLGESAAALSASLARPAGWVFAAATDDATLDAQRAAFDPVRPHNLTLAPLAEALRWCPRAEVVVAADWQPPAAISAPGALETARDGGCSTGAGSPDALASGAAGAAPSPSLARLLEIAERALVVTGWRSVSGDRLDGDAGAEAALAFARQHALEVRSVSTPVDDDRARTVVIISRAG